jgi:hypothetical protein
MGRSDYILGRAKVISPKRVAIYTKIAFKNICQDREKPLVSYFQDVM